MPEKLNHNYVAEKATRLIMKLHRCPIGATDFSGGFSGERVDGFCYNQYGSFVIEAKVSRSDFQCDKKKSFRNNPALGIGKYRYYACPEGMILPNELPDRWGLIYIMPGGRCSMPVGYGGFIKKGERRGAEGWNEPYGDIYGTKQKPDAPRNNEVFAFNERNTDAELNFLFYLAKRYKQNKFMDNIL